MFSIRSTVRNTTILAIKRLNITLTNRIVPFAVAVAVAVAAVGACMASWQVQKNNTIMMLSRQHSHARRRITVFSQRLTLRVCAMRI